MHTLPGRLASILCSELCRSQTRKKGHRHTKADFSVNMNTLRAALLKTKLKLH